MTLLQKTIDKIKPASYLFLITAAALPVRKIVQTNKAPIKIAGTDLSYLQAGILKKLLAFIDHVSLRTAAFLTC